MLRPERSAIMNRASSCALILLLALTMGLAVSCRKQGPAYDLVIINGRVLDGSGAEPVEADVAVTGDTIAHVGSIEPAMRAQARRVIDARGLVVSPGFIDIHTHSDYCLLVDGTAQSKIRQGVTTEILGEADSAGPVQGRARASAPYGLQVDWRTLGEYFKRLESGGVSVNVGSFVGATQVRRCVLGEESREPTHAEMDEMKRLVTEAMQDGALGLSVALLVPPNTYHTTSQLIELASAVEPFGGIYLTHIRSEGEGIETAIGEALEVAEKARVPVEVLHLKIADHRLWGRMNEVCDLIEQARSRSIKASADLYPYIAGQNNLVALVPPWAMEGGREKMLTRLRNPAERRRIERDLYAGIPGWYNHYLAMKSWDGCMVASVGTEANKQYEGKSIAEIARLSGRRPADAVFDLLIDEKGSVPAVYFLMSEEDLRHAMRRPWVSIGSDGSALRPDGPLGSGKPHPRSYGTFPRVLGRYVREEQVLTLPKAIRKMTSLNAEKLGIEDRGLLRAGKKADITVFDPDRVADRATFENPHQYPVGIEYVIVNGVPVIEKEQHLGTRPGRILMGASHQCPK
jgi:N-acyl-D-amino-acid deacylase